MNKFETAYLLFRNARFWIYVEYLVAILVRPCIAKWGKL